MQNKFFYFPVFFGLGMALVYIYKYLIENTSIGENEIRLFKEKIEKMSTKEIINEAVKGLK